MTVSSTDSETTHAQMEAWLRVHDPANYTGNGGIHTPEVLDRLGAIATAIGADGAPSQAAVTGPDASVALTADRNAANLLKQGGPTSPEFLEAWKTDYVGAAVTLSEMSRNAAGYQPQLIDNSGANATAYQSYLTRIGSCPLFVLKMSDRQTLERTTTDWNTIIDAIADTFQGIQAEDKNKIVDGLKNLAKAASSTMKTTEKENVFVQNALNVDGVVTLYLYNSTITFYEESGKGFDSKQNTFDVTRLELQFQTRLWPQYVAAVAAKFTSTVDDWLTNNSTQVPAAAPAIPAFA